MFGATVAAPFLIAQGIGMPTAELGYLISFVYITMGLATILQGTFGCKLPFIMGSSFSYIPPIISVGQVYAPITGNFGMPAISVGLVGSGAVHSLVGFSRLVGTIRKYITPTIVAPTLICIGLALVPYSALLSYQPPGPWLMFLTIAIIIFLTYFTKGFPSYTAVFWGAVIGYIIGFASGVVDLTEFYQAPLFRPPALFPWGYYLDALPILILLFGSLAVIIESTGDVFSLSILTETMTHKWHLNRAVAAEGLGIMGGGLLGGIACTTYSENIGLVGLTGVASRYVTIGAGAIALALGMIPKFGALIAAMPKPVLGGVTFITYGMIAAAGMKQLEIIPMSARNMFIIGTAVTLGLGMPLIINGAYGITSPVGPWLLAHGAWGRALYTLGNTSMAVAAISAAVMDYIIPGSEEERGMAYVKEVLKVQKRAPIAF